MWRMLLGVFFSVTLVACQGNQMGAREKGALTGGALGAGLGAIIGHEAGSTGAGVAIGTAAGVLAGGLIGNESDRADARAAETETRLERNERIIQENQHIIDQLKQRGADVRETDRGVIVNLPDVLFEFDSSRLTADAERTIGDISQVLRDVQSRRISVEGHTDSIGTIAYNQRLSESRARSVAGRLAHDGISRGRIVTRGLGESDPVSSNRTEHGRQRNRRVEVIVENF